MRRADAVRRRRHRVTPRALVVLVAIAALALVTAPGAAAQGPGCVSGLASFAFTGAEQCYLVPDDAVALAVVVVGAPGHAGGAVGGAGARVAATVPVTGPGIVYVNVGGAAQGAAGGFNGGGNSNAGGGGGGGASDLRTCSITASCPGGPGLLVVAGGGGGGGADASATGGDGGAAGATAAAGTAGTDEAPDASGGTGGGGATAVGGGAGGTGGAGTVPPGAPGDPGVALAGGGGGGNGGGGGGGYFGGGGGGGGGRNSTGNKGGGGGGGGGSSFAIAAASGVAIGTDTTLTPSVEITPLAEAVATTSPASGLAPTAATLNAVVNPRGLATSARFEYVSDAGFAPATSDPYAAGADTAVEAVGGDATNHLVQAAVSGLEPATTYHFRVVAEGFSIVDGADQVFMTPAASSPFADVAVDASGRPRRQHRGGRLTYRLRVVDTGPATAKGVTLLIDLPRGARKVRAPANCDGDGVRSLACDLGDLAPGQLTALRLRLRAGHRGAAKLRAHVLSQTLDTNPLNDGATVKSRIKRR